MKPRHRPYPSRVARCIAGLLLAVASVAAGRDFPQPFSMSNPFSIAQETGFFAGGRADLAYHDYTFLRGPHDLFSLRQRTAVALANTSRFAAGLYYQNHLLVGPVSPGEDPFSIAEWHMNALHFEYGAVVAWRLPPVVAFEYGRTSHHPLRGGYSEVSSDIVELSVYGDPLRWRRGSVLTGVRLAHVDLYDFWKSPLLRPRTRFRLEAPVEAVWKLPREELAIVARVWPRLLVMRREGAWPYAQVEPPVQTEIDIELGIRFERRSGIELLLEFHSTADTEQVHGEPAPLTTLGIVARVTAM